MKTIIVILVVVCLVLGYGYWNYKNYAFVMINTRFTDSLSFKEPLLFNAKVYFYSPNNELLAEGRGVDKHNFVHLVHPEVGDCLEYSYQTSEWTACYKKRAKWIASWVEQVKSVKVKYQNCSTSKIPVEASKNSPSWYLWWVPIRHFGGSLSSDYNLKVIIDRLDCNSNKEKQL